MELCDLPDEILVMILKYACNKDLKDVFNCTQVNHHWKNVIESWYIFPKSNFFKISRAKEEFQLARNSNRRYKIYVMEFSCKFVANNVWIESILRKSERTLNEVYLTLGLEKKITEVRFEYFYNLWKLIWNLEAIHIRFVNFAFDEKDVDPKRKLIEFPRLKCLDILWNRNDYWYGLLVDDEDEKLDKEKKEENKENKDTKNEENLNKENENKKTEEKEAPKKKEPSVSDPGRAEDKPEKTEENKNVVYEYIEEEDQDEELEEVVARNLLVISNTPQLETLKIRVPEYYYDNALKDFFRFINKNSRNLKKIYIWNEKSYCFHWYNEYLYIWYNTEMHEGLDIFLAGRSDNIKQFKLHFRFDKEFLARIFRDARNLEYFETSIDLSILEHNDVFPKIKTLTIWNFKINRESILKLYSNFPNTEVLRLAHVQFEVSEIELIRETFTRLKDLQKYNTESNVYKSVM